MTSMSIAQKHDATVGNYLWPINFFWFTQLNQEAPNCFTPWQAQTRPTIRLSLSEEGSIATLKSACCLAINPIALQSVSLVALLSASLPCNQPRRLSISLTSGLAVSLVALQSAPSHCSQSHHLAVDLIAFQSAPLPCSLVSPPCSRFCHLAVGPITLQLSILSPITCHRAES